MTQRNATTSADEAMYYAIVPAADRRQGARRPAGAAATVTRMLSGRTTAEFHVLITDSSDRGVGLRSPVPLEHGAIYRITTLAQDVGHVRIVRSRLREDGTYDVGALYTGAAERARSAA